MLYNKRCITHHYILHRYCSYIACHLRGLGELVWRELVLWRELVCTILYPLDESYLGYIIWEGAMGVCLSNINCACVLSAQWSEPPQTPPIQRVLAWGELPAAHWQSHKPLCVARLSHTLFCVMLCFFSTCFLHTCTVLPRTEARAFNKLNEKRMLKAPRTDAHVLLFENVRLLLNCWGWCLHLGHARCLSVPVRLFESA